MVDCRAYASLICFGRCSANIVLCTTGRSEATCQHRPRLVEKHSHRRLPVGCLVGLLLSACSLQPRAATRRGTWSMKLGAGALTLKLTLLTRARRVPDVRLQRCRRGPPSNTVGRPRCIGVDRLSLPGMRFLPATIIAPTSHSRPHLPSRLISPYTPSHSPLLPLPLLRKEAPFPEPTAPFCRAPAGADPSRGGRPAPLPATLDAAPAPMPELF